MSGPPDVLDGSAGPCPTDAPHTLVDVPLPDAARYAQGMEIGRGAMGHVHLVHDRHLVRDLAWKEGAAHVLREARVTAQLEHPGILPVHDLGATPDGRSFFAMRAVRGRTFAAALADLQRPPTAQATLALVRALLQAAQAVAWAHHRGVVHRDLKPSNIMVGPFGEVLVIDWGLALVLDDATLPLSREARAAIPPLSAEAVGTPRYMAPEQARGQAERPSDVWALGLILLETLAARFDPATHTITWPPSAPLELQAIATRALAAEPAARYPHAGALADDLSAFLDGRRVDAYVYRRRDHVRRFVRAFRLPLAVGLAALVALIVVGVLAFDRVADERDHALASEAVAKRAHEAADRSLAEALVSEARTLARQRLRPEAEATALRALALGEHPEARGILASFATSPGPTHVTSSRLPSCRAYELGRRRHLCRDDGRTTVLEPTAGGRFVRGRGWPSRAALSALTDDDRRVVEAGRHTPFVVHDLAHGTTSLDPHACSGAERMAVADRYVLIWNHLCATLADSVSATTRALMVCPEIYAATVAADGTWALACPGAIVHGSVDGPPEVLAIADYAHPEHRPVALAVSNDKFIVVDTRGRLELRDTAGTRVRRIDAMTDMARVLAPSPDGRWVAIAGDTGSVYVYDLPGLGLHTTLPAEHGSRLIWSAPDTLSTLASDPIHVATWRMRPGPAARHVFDEGVVALAIDETDAHLLVGHEAHATIVDLTQSTHEGLTFDGDGIKSVFFDKADAYVGTTLGHLTRSAPGGNVALPFPATPTRRYAVLGDWFVALPYGSDAKAAPINDPNNSVTLDFGITEDKAAYWLDLDEAGERAIALRGGLVREITASPGPPTTRVLGAAPDGVAVAAFAHGHEVAVAEPDRVVIYGSDDFAPRIALVAPGHDLLEIATSPDARLVAAGTRDGTVLVWDRTQPTPLLVWRGHEARVVALTFDRSGHLATGSWDGAVALLDLTVARAPVATLLGAHATRWGQ